MPIIKKDEKERGFTQLSNEPIQDENLSWKAKGILLYLFSRPDDWNFNKKEIQEKASVGRVATNNGIKELQEAGYLEIRNKKDKDTGKFIGKVWIIREVPETHSDRTSENLKFGGPATTNKDNTNKESNNKDSSKELQAEPDFASQEDIEDYGRSDINWLMRRFKEIMGFESGGPKKKNRRYAKHLLDNFNHKQIEALIVTSDKVDYPTIGSVQDLWFNRGKLQKKIKDKKEKAQQNKTHKL